MLNFNILKRNHVGNWQINVFGIIIGRHLGYCHVETVTFCGHKFNKPYITRNSIDYVSRSTGKHYYVKF